MRAQLTVGVDLVKISSMREMLATGGSSFRELCFTAGELAHCQGSHRGSPPDGLPKRPP